MEKTPYQKILETVLRAAFLVRTQNGENDRQSLIKAFNDEVSLND